MNPISDSLVQPGNSPEFKFSNQQIEAQARALLAQLTLDEKIEMMDGDLSFWGGMVEMMGGGYNDHPWTRA